MLVGKIDTDFKVALKNKNEITVSALRNLKAEIKNAEIAAQIGRDKQKVLTDEEVLAIVRKKIKQHKDSIESFTAGNRADLVAHEQAQMQVLQAYLPAALSEDEVRKTVKDVVAKMAAGPADFGKVMKEVLSQLKGSADGSVVSKIVKEELE